MQGDCLLANKAPLTSFSATRSTELKISQLQGRVRERTKGKTIYGDEREKNVFWCTGQPRKSELDPVHTLTFFSFPFSWPLAILSGAPSGYNFFLVSTDVPPSSVAIRSGRMRAQMLQQAFSPLCSIVGIRAHAVDPKAFFTSPQSTAGVHPTGA
jgi:hypothetical protein